MLKIILLRFFCPALSFLTNLIISLTEVLKKIEIVRNDILTESFEGAEEGGEEELIFEGVTC